MNEGRPYLQMWRGVWVSFCKIAIVSFLSIRYRSDGLYCRMAGTRSSPTMLFIRVGIKIELVMMVGLPSCNVGRPIYIWRIRRKICNLPALFTAFADKAFPRSSFYPTRSWCSVQRTGILLVRVEIRHIPLLESWNQQHSSLISSKPPNEYILSET